MTNDFYFNMEEELGTSQISLYQISVWRDTMVLRDKYEDNIVSCEIVTHTHTHTRNQIVTCRPPFTRGTFNPKIDIGYPIVLRTEFSP